MVGGRKERRWGALAIARFRTVYTKNYIPVFFSLVRGGHAEAHYREAILLTNHYNANRVASFERPPLVSPPRALFLALGLEGRFVAFRSGRPNVTRHPITWISDVSDCNRTDHHNGRIIPHTEKILKGFAQYSSSTTTFPTLSLTS